MDVFDQLEEILEKRLEVIADTEWRDRDANAHLEALKQVSEQLEEWKSRYLDLTDPQLRHFLDGYSLQKALNHLKK